MSYFEYYMSKIVFFKTNTAQTLISPMPCFGLGRAYSLAKTALASTDVTKGKNISALGLPATV